jgi:hypothetical protein
MPPVKPKVCCYSWNFGPQPLLTPPKSEVVDPAPCAQPLLWAQLLEPPCPIYLAEWNLHRRDAIDPLGKEFRNAM